MRPLENTDSDFRFDFPLRYSHVPICATSGNVAGPLHGYWIKMTQCFEVYMYNKIFKVFSE